MVVFNVVSVSDLKWNNREHTSFDCVVKLEDNDELIPITINSKDEYAHIQALWKNVLDNKYGSVDEYIEPELPIDIPPLTLEELLKTL